VGRVLIIGLVGVDGVLSKKMPSKHGAQKAEQAGLVGQKKGRCT